MKKFDPELFNLNLEIIIRTPQRRIAIRFTLTKVISALVLILLAAFRFMPSK